MDPQALLSALLESSRHEICFQAVFQLVKKIVRVGMIEDELRTTLKAWLKQTQDIIHTMISLTVIHSISLNSTPAVRAQLAGSRWAPRLEKILQKPQAPAIGAAVAQMLVDWAFLFGGTEPLGAVSRNILLSSYPRKHASLIEDAISDAKLVCQVSSRAVASPPHFLDLSNTYPPRGPTDEVSSVSEEFLMGLPPVGPRRGPDFVKMYSMAVQTAVSSNQQQQQQQLALLGHAPVIPGDAALITGLGVISAPMEWTVNAMQSHARELQDQVKALDVLLRQHGTGYKHQSSTAEVVIMAAMRRGYISAQRCSVWRGRVQELTLNLSEERSVSQLLSAIDLVNSALTRWEELTTNRLYSAIGIIVPQGPLGIRNGRNSSSSMDLLGLDELLGDLAEGSRHVTRVNSTSGYQAASGAGRGDYSYRPQRAGPAAVTASARNPSRGQATQGVDLLTPPSTLSMDKPISAMSFPISRAAPAAGISSSSSAAVQWPPPRRVTSAHERISHAVHSAASAEPGAVIMAGAGWSSSSTIHPILSLSATSPAQPQAAQVQGNKLAISNPAAVVALELDVKVAALAPQMQPAQQNPEVGRWEHFPNAAAVDQRERSVLRADDAGLLQGSLEVTSAASATIQSDGTKSDSPAQREWEQFIAMPTQTTDSSQGGQQVWHQEQLPQAVHPSQPPQLPHASFQPTPSLPVGVETTDLKIQNLCRSLIQNHSKCPTCFASAKGLPDAVSQLQRLIAQLQLEHASAMEAATQTFHAELSSIKAASLIKIKEVMRNCQLHAVSTTALPPPPSLPASGTTYLSPHIHSTIVSPSLTSAPQAHNGPQAPIIGALAERAISGAALPDALMVEAVYIGCANGTAQQQQQQQHLTALQGSMSSSSQQNGVQGSGYPLNQQYSSSRMSHQPPVTEASAASNAAAAITAGCVRVGGAVSPGSLTHSDWML
ncbi:hypothetical protein CEUSTIGMA_g7357.t1 [Chlamydomonas eustigma]|uniref:VHS domain-containing protein n=1 Tax=Chlamydomonas eustigma TaxID=1157962 RepID=A0A250XA19_9CHLO|nr:hypothetical protein CEUSTIGMA_g7357.t1 [Chlamydomonas eustigma]|eukprot:GAX79917.1 hypothetical protein CEUSTIGMA_g7357.t1 [Chlamydomonas eustigma]